MLIAITVSLFWVVVLWVLVEDFQHLHIPFFASPILFIAGMVFAYNKGGGEAVLYGLVGSILVAAALFATGRAFRRFRGVDGLGAADPAFTAALAIWISPDLVPWAVVLACLVTLAFIPVLKRVRRHQGDKLPFAPGLGLGFGLVLMSQIVFTG